MSAQATVNMFYAGNFADMDTDESDWDTENPGAVLQTFDDLVITELVEYDTDHDGVIYDDEAGTSDYVQYDTGAGTQNVALDSSSLYDADILLGDGSTMSVPVLVLQTTNGDVFISEYPTNSLDGLSIQSISLTNLNDSNAGGINLGQSNVQNARVVCFAEGTLIATTQGQVAVETLVPGDVVLTLDHGPQTIRWTRSDLHTIDPSDDGASPVLIAVGALAAGVPATDLIVSPQHRVFVGGHRHLQDIFPDEAFVPAKALTSLPKIRFMNGKKQITWVHFACDDHEVVLANGALAESLLLGPMVVNGLSVREKIAVARVFGMPRDGEAALNGPPARTCLTVKQVRGIIENARANKRTIRRAARAADGAEMKAARCGRDIETVA